jgi:hypothetical protein
MVPLAEALAHEVDLLKEWFKKDYPESELRVTSDFNALLYTLKIQIEVLAGEEVSKDRLYFKSTPIVLSERDLRNEALMYGFVKEFNKQVRIMVQNVFNKHYLEQKQKEFTV